MQSISNYLETQRNTQGVEDDIDAILQEYINFNYKYRKSEKADMYKGNTIIREIKGGKILGEKK